MYRVLEALVAGRRHEGQNPPDEVERLLISAIRLLISNPPMLITSTSVYAATSSPEQAQLLAKAAIEIAAENHLVAVVDLGSGSFRVKFRRKDDLGTSSDRR
ncbi:MAG TPA: hypothetical protein VGR43_02890 [Dehalococcoidia bacterium]|jgi:hypothetical protein|nr:hypothetical protein [Dehalococcoidia bacterium]